MEQSKSAATHRAGAAKITGQPLQRIEVHGKNLFYFFGPEKGEQTVMHVRRHAQGMSTQLGLYAHKRRLTVWQGGVALHLAGGSDQQRP